MQTVWFVFLALIVAAQGQPLPPDPDICLGEYSVCNATGECTLGACGVCKKGQYVCPDQTTCIDSAEEYVHCPNLKGTHLDWTLSEEARLDYLLSHTSLAEQIAQLTNNAPAIERLGIPSYNWLNDDEHGIATKHATVFPDGPGLGASWDRDLLHEVGLAVGLEARGGHNGYVHDGQRGQKNENGVGITMYAPNMNLVRDPRWGRAQEVYSEDPCLSSELTRGYVTGGQGSALNATPIDPKYMLAGACCKHYAAYDIENIPVDRYHFNAIVDPRSMWEHYMPVFRTCVVESRAMHVMCSYNAINGVPTCADGNLMNGILRKKWKWDGFVVSDYDAWANINTTYGYAKTMEDAAAFGLNAGLDQEGGGTDAINKLAAAVSHGKTTAGAVQAAARRLFRMRIRLGMFDPPTLNRWNRVPFSIVESPQHISLNRRAAAAGISLYRNVNNTLPFSLSSFTQAKPLVVVGPTAPDGDNLQGNYAQHTDIGAVSILEGLQSALGNDSVVYVSGCPTVECTDQSGFAEAVAAAKSGSAVVVVLGTKHDCSDPIACEGEGHDRSSIEFAGQQLTLAAALAHTNTPLVCVLVHGGSMALRNLLTDCDAIVDAWFPGAQGGNGVADVLFGKVNPAGRSPQTFYKSNDDLPPMGNMDLYNPGITYRYYKKPVDIPFGFGLSYTTFSYSNLVVNASSIRACDTVLVSVTVTNTGDVDGEEVVQLYVKQPSASAPVPQVRLADFDRVRVSAGHSARVDLLLRAKYRFVVPNSATMWDPQSLVEAGPVSISVGGGQPDYYKGSLSATITVADSARLDDCGQQ